MEKKYENFKFSNLLDFSEKIEKSLLTFYLNYDSKSDSSDKYNKFNLLGEFYRVEDKKQYQIYFRKLQDPNVVDFLMYDLSEIRDSQIMDINSQNKFFSDLIFEIKNPINMIMNLILIIGNLNIFVNKKKKISLSDSVNITDDNIKKIPSLGNNFNHGYSKKNINYIKENFNTLLENICNFILLYTDNIIEYCNINLNENKSKGINRKLTIKNEISRDLGGLITNKSNINSKNIARVFNVNENNIEHLNSDNDSGSKRNLNKTNQNKYEKIDIKEIADYCKNFCSSILTLFYKDKSGTIEVICEIEGFIEKIEIFSDSLKIKQILLNFISNSLKNTKKGYIKIRFEILETEKKLLISVIDTGIGIDDKTMNILLSEDLNIDKINKINKINDKIFNKKSNSLISKKIGIGIKITKYLVKVLNIQLNITSKIGLGSEFSIFIPYTEDKIIPSNFINTNLDTKLEKKDTIVCKTNMDIVSYDSENVLKKINIYNLNREKEIIVEEKKLKLEEKTKRQNNYSISSMDSSDHNGYNDNIPKDL